MALLKEGKAAPVFSLPASNGETISLKAMKGKYRVVIYFYPKDDTPGCTTEACGFRDQSKAFQKLETMVFGISPDNTSSHQQFIKKYKLPFILLSDEKKEVCKAFGVWVKKSMYGREYMGVARTTFVINRDGKIGKIFEKVKPEGHEQEVLDYLSA